MADQLFDLEAFLKSLELSDTALKRVRAAFSRPELLKSPITVELAHKLVNADPTQQKEFTPYLTKLYLSTANSGHKRFEEDIEKANAYLWAIKELQSHSVSVVLSKEDPNTKIRMPLPLADLYDAIAPYLPLFVTKNVPVNIRRILRIDEVDATQFEPEEKAITNPQEKAILSASEPGATIIANTDVYKLVRINRTSLAFAPTPSETNIVAKFRAAAASVFNRAQGVIERLENTRFIPQIVPDTVHNLLCDLSGLLGLSYSDLGLAAARFYGRGTQFCTSMDDTRDHYDDYIRRGPLYMLLLRGSNIKFQFHFNACQIANHTDRGVSIDSILQTISPNKAVQDQLLQVLGATALKDANDRGNYPDMPPRLYMSFSSKEWDVVEQVLSNFDRDHNNEKRYTERLTRHLTTQTPEQQLAFINFLRFFVRTNSMVVVRSLPRLLLKNLGHFSTDTQPAVLDFVTELAGVNDSYLRKNLKRYSKAQRPFLMQRWPEQTKQLYASLQAR